MSDTLAQLTTKLQALMLDDGTLFTSTTCTAAIRQALKTINTRVPVHAAVTVSIVAGQYVYELTPAEAGAIPLTIYDVLLESTTPADYEVPLEFDAYSEDERLFYRLRYPQQSGTLLVRFTQAHTISGLDSATESTLTPLAEVVLLDGAAEQVCIIASAGKSEANNLDANTTDAYRKAASRFAAAFAQGLKALDLAHRIPLSVPSTIAWNDEWHNRLQ